MCVCVVINNRSFEPFLCLDLLQGSVFDQTDKLFHWLCSCSFVIQSVVHRNSRWMCDRGPRQTDYLTKHYNYSCHLQNTFALKYGTLVSRLAVAIIVRQGQGGDGGRRSRRVKESYWKDKSP